MKYRVDRPYADPEIVARKIIELANEFEPVRDGRIYIEKINDPFLFQRKGTPAGRVRGGARSCHRQRLATAA